MSALTYVEAAPTDANRDAAEALRTTRERREPLPPLGPRLQLVRGALLMVLVLCASVVLHLLVVSGLQHRTSQTQALAELRSRLAQGTAPVGPADNVGTLLDHGAPVALLEIPAIDVEEVVVEGTRARDLFIGPGHRRDTPLPGQLGVSIVAGRKDAYGGPFERIDSLEPDDEITVTTGQGEFAFRVLGVRRAGDPLPPPLTEGEARLTLVSADGGVLFPRGLVRVDAVLEGPGVIGYARQLTSATLPDDEAAMSIQTDTLWVLALWLQLLIVLAVATVWLVQRWGRPLTWVVAAPPLAFVGLAAAGETARLLPNLM